MIEDAHGFGFIRLIIREYFKVDSINIGYQVDHESFKT